jgi:hypothetical protein
MIAVSGSSGRNPFNLDPARIPKSFADISDIVFLNS